MISPKQFKIGMVIKLDGRLYSIVAYQHVKPGKGPAYYRTKLKDLKNESIIEKTLRSGDKIEEVFLTEKKFTYLYNTQEIYFFMDQESYEQVPINKKKISNIVDYLLENTEVKAILSGKEIIQIKLPTFMALSVKYTEPSVKGDTAKTTTTKDAILESGARLQVPIFIKQGDKIMIDTRTKQYIGKSR